MLQSSIVAVTYCMVQETPLPLLCLYTTAPIPHSLNDAVTSAWRAAWRWCVTAWSRRQPCSCCCPPPHSTRPISSTCAGKLANLSALKEHSLVVMQDTCVGYDAIQVGTARWCRTTLTALLTHSILFQCPYSGKRKVLLTNIQMMSQILSIYN